MTRPTATPNRLILHPATEADPRLDLDSTALVEASRNAFPIVAGRQAKRDSMGLVAGGGVALLLGGITFWSMSGHREPQRAPVPPAAQVAPQPPVLLPAPQPLLPATTPSQQAPQSFRLPATTPYTGTPSITEARRAPVLVFDASGAPVARAGDGITAAPVPGAVPARPAGPVIGGVGGDNDQFASRVGSNGVEVATAQAMADPANTVTQGTLIPAVLETAIDTDLPGYVRAVVSRDVRSFDGTRVLIPRSSRLIGQYKSGLAAGQTRAYVIWTRIIRPDGASVALASPSVDAAGRSGLAGKVDGHFMKRFGSAVLLSVVGGLAAIGNSAVVVSGGQSAASVAAQRDVQIPPTIRVAQGQPIRVFTARDLDFSTVVAAGADG